MPGPSVVGDVVPRIQGSEILSDLSGRHSRLRLDCACFCRNLKARYKAEKPEWRQFFADGGGRLP